MNIGLFTKYQMIILKFPKSIEQKTREIKVMSSESYTVAGTNSCDMSKMGQSLSENFKRAFFNVNKMA